MTPEGIRRPVLSPDGKSFLARSNAGEFSVFPVEGGPSRPARGFEPTDSPLRWASDGHSVFVRGGTNQPLARVYRVDMKTGRREVWKEFVPDDLVGIRLVMPATISADGQTVLFSYQRTPSDLYPAEGLK